MKALTTITLIITLLIVTITTISGCGNRELPPGFPKLYPVSVKVIQDGKPLEEASVTLQPAAGKFSAAGKTDASGIAELWTYGKHKGAPAGEFKVLVEKRFNEGEEEYIAAMNRHDEAAADKITVRSWSFVEVKFGDAAATPLTVNVDGNTKMLEVDVSPAVKTEIPYMK